MTVEHRCLTCRTLLTKWSPNVKRLAEDGCEDIFCYDCQAWWEQSTTRTSVYAYAEAFVMDGDRQLLDADSGAYDVVTDTCFDDGIGGLPRPLVDRDAIVNYELQVEATLSLAFSHFVRGPETAKVARGILSRLLGWAEQEDRSITSRYVPPQRESFFEYDPSEPSEAERQADRLAGRDPQ